MRTRSRQIAVSLVVVSLLAVAVPVLGNGLRTMDDPADGPVAPVVDPTAHLAGQAPQGPAHDDAGSGRDAGDTLDLALRLPHGGAYTGNMSPSLSDTDWFAPPAISGGPACAEASVRASISTRITLARDGAAVTIRTPSGGYQDLALATPYASTFLGVRPGNSPAGPVDPYRFDVDVRGVADLPRPLAGLDATSAAPVDFGCFAGTYGGTAAWYALDVRAGRHTTVSFADAGAGLTVRVVDDAGNVRGTLTSGEIGGYYVSYSGTWHLVVEGPEAGLQSGGMSSTDDDYTVSTTDSDDPPSTNGCRPNCDSTLSLE